MVVAVEEGEEEEEKETRDRERERKRIEGKKKKGNDNCLSLSPFFFPPLSKKEMYENCTVRCCCIYSN